MFNNIIALNKKVGDLENQIKDIKNENNFLKNKLNDEINEKREFEKKVNEKLECLQKQINDLKNEKTIIHSPSSEKMFINSNIIKSDDIDLILSWLDKKPKKSIYY